MGLGRFFKKHILRKQKKKNRPSSPKGISKPKHGTRSGNSPTSPKQNSPIYTAFRPSASDPTLAGATSAAYTAYRPGQNPSQAPAPINTAGIASTGTGAGYVPNSQILANQALAENQKNRKLTKKYVQGLNKHGAINADWKTLPALDYGIEGRPEDLNMRKRVPNVKEPNEPIHPCFRRTMFYNISNADYELIKPSLRLASCYLDDPRIIPFFHGVLHRPTTLHPLLGKIKKHDLGKALYTFRERHPLNDAEWMTTYKAIAETRKYIDFEFGPQPQDAVGFTIRNDKHLPDGRIDTSRTRRASITIHEDFLPILRGNQKPSSILLPDELGEPLDDASALLRVRFMLAKVLLHEFAHAFSHIHYPLDYDVPTQTYWDEPFYGDHRLSEMGFALEQFVNNGVVIQTIRGNERSSVDCAYGLMTMRFPGIMRGHSSNAWELAPPIKYGIVSDTYFAVPMDFIANVFTRGFWDDVKRFGGLEAFRPRRVPGLSVTYMDRSVADPRDSPGFRRVADEPVGGGYDPADLRTPP